MRRTSKEEILDYYKDINEAYNDCGRYEDLSNFLDRFAMSVRVDAIDEIDSLVRNHETGWFSYEAMLSDFEKLKEEKDG